MADEEQTNKKPEYTVLSRKSYGGGPFNLGDPDDRSLRRVEKDILVAKIVRDRAREEKCIPEVAEFNKCCKGANLFMVVACRKENAELKACLEKWYKDEKFWEECKEQYLKERSDYRSTGLPKKVRDFKARYQSNM